MPTRSAPLIARRADLSSRWLALCDHLQITRRQSVPTGQRLLGRWDQVPRCYHDTRHLLACLQALDGIPPDADGAPLDRPVCALALWFHDAIYAPRRHDNEALSAAWARRFLQAAGQPQDRFDAVVFLILQTQHFAPPVATSVPTRWQHDAAWLLDIDLGILGQPPAVFARFEADVRKEYRHVPDAPWRARRAAVLQSFLDRNRIFRTAHFHDRLEASARSNLAAAIAALRGTMPG